jgi:hypothetical protein
VGYFGKFRSGGEFGKQVLELERGLARGAVLEFPFRNVPVNHLKKSHPNSRMEKSDQNGHLAGCVTFLAMRTDVPLLVLGCRVQVSQMTRARAMAFLKHFFTRCLKSFSY